MSMPRLTIRTPEQRIEEVDQLVETGQYPNRSEAVRAAIRRLCREELTTEDRRELRARNPQPGGPEDGRQAVVEWAAFTDGRKPHEQ